MQFRYHARRALLAATRAGTEVLFVLEEIDRVSTTAICAKETVRTNLSAPWRTIVLASTGNRPRRDIAEPLTYLGSECGQVKTCSSRSVPLEDLHVHVVLANQLPKRTTVLACGLRSPADVAVMGKQKPLNVVLFELLDRPCLGLLK